MRNVGFSVFLTCILLRLMRNAILLADERYQITYSKRVTRAVKMVDSCSRENGVLCTVARSWLLLLHDESEWKNFESSMLEVLMKCTKHFDFNSSLTASCVARFMICWVCRLYFSGLVCSVLSLDECLIKINYGRLSVCFRCLENLILWSRLCLAEDKFRYHRSHVYLILLSGVNDLRR